MRFTIEHTIRYRYDRPVFIEPTAIRLRPQHDSRQRLIEHDLHITPEPAGIAAMADIDGNETTNLWFNGLHESLTITTKSVVETQMVDPFRYVLPQDALALPMGYEQPLAGALSPYLHRDCIDETVNRFAHDLLETMQRDTTNFVMSLTTQLNAMIAMEVRVEGDPYPPAKTLAEGRGACRDVAVLFMDVCRAVGLASRFVSGYKAFNLIPGTNHDLHGWAAVYLPGAGWRGYDPSEGVAVADRHVVLAAACDPALAAPTTGTFRGTNASASLDHVVHIAEA